MVDNPDVYDSNIASMTKLFESTGNVAAAWCAFNTAFSQGREIPDSIFKEVERFSAGIAVAAQRAITAEVGAVPITISPEDLHTLWRGECKRDPVGWLQREWRNYKLYWAMRNRVKTGSTVAEAAKEVRAMDGVGLSERSLENLWKSLNSDG